MAGYGENGEEIQEMWEVVRLGSDCGIFSGRTKNLEFDIIGNGESRIKLFFLFFRIIHVYYKTLGEHKEIHWEYQVFLCREDLTTYL